MLGDTDSILGSVTGNAQLIESQREIPQKIGMEQAATAQAPDNAAGKMGAETTAQNNANMVSISPQMAAGLEKMTGQKWDQTVGTKWRSDVFTAIVTGMAQAKYHQDVLTGKVTVEKMKEGASAEKTEVTETGKDVRQDKSIEAKHQDVKTQQEGADKRAATPKPKVATPKDPTDQGKQLMDTLLKASKSGDESAKTAAVSNYNSFAKEHGLAEYKGESGSGFMEFAHKAMNALKGLGKMIDEEGNADKAKNWLKKNHPELKNPSDADVEWAKKKMNG